MLLIGGSSEIGLAIVRRLVRGSRARLVLADRPSPRLLRNVHDLAAEGHHVHLETYDTAYSREETSSLLDRAEATVGAFDVVVIAVGYQGRDEEARAVAEPGLDDLLRDSLTGPAMAAELAMGRFAEQECGSVIVVTSAPASGSRGSVLGYRVGKQALDSFVVGLDRRARTHGVRCYAVRPGPVRTRTSVPRALDPEQIADAVVAGLGRRSTVVWAPGRPRLITALLRIVPDRLLTHWL